MVNLTLAVGGLWGTIISWFNSFLPSFGITIIVFTILLKLVLSPLEVWQKVSTKKQMEQQARLQPQLDKINKQCGNNKELANKKTMELYQKEKVNPMGSCLGMLINLVITLVVFFTLFTSLNQISQFNIKTEYENLREEYVTVYNQTYTGTNAEEAKEAAQTAVVTKYGEIKEGFLWIKNIYRPDTWSSVFPNSEEYLSISNTKFKNVDETPYRDIYGNEHNTEAAAKTQFLSDFNDVTGKINETYSGWNGWLILVILSAGVTVLSQIITTLTTKTKKQYDKKGNEIPVKTPSNKLMLILLPALMVIFTIQYSSAFALYIVINSLMSVLIGFVTTLIMNQIEKKKELKSTDKIFVKGKGE